MDRNGIILHNFEGPLNYLFQLVRKGEIDVCDVPIKTIIDQYLEKLESKLSSSLNSSAEFVGTVASLLCLKSVSLIPQHEDVTQTEGTLDDEFAIIHHLLDYCHFKEVAKELTYLEEKRSAHYFRAAIPPSAKKKPPMPEELTLDDLCTLFLKMLKENPQHQLHLSDDEQWNVFDKISSIQHQLTEEPLISISQLFSQDKPKAELIVTFLAILELMKQGLIRVLKKENEPPVIQQR